MTTVEKTCSADLAGDAAAQRTPPSDRLGFGVAPDSSARAMLQEIAHRHGTPTYAFDVRRLQLQTEKLRTSLPNSIEIFYSLKANASLGLCDVFAKLGVGADTASAGELATALAAGFPDDRIFAAGPYKSLETIELLRSNPQAVVSVDSLGELRDLTALKLPNKLVLRLRPDYESTAVVAAGSESRFGIVVDDLRRFGAPSTENVIGFHVFSGSQVLDPAGIVKHFRGAVNLSLRAADILQITPQFLNLGGGLGIPYGGHQRELDLAPIADELESVLQRVTPARVALELGRYLVATSGWYLTTVVGRQTYQGRGAVVVDGGTHQRADLCGLCLQTKAYPPVVLAKKEGEASVQTLAPTDVLGCLSLPADVLCKASPLPRLEVGDVLAFANAGAYGLWSSPAIFHGSPLPAEVAFDGSSLQVMRPRQSARSILNDQCRVEFRR